MKASPELIDQFRQAYGGVEAKLNGNLGNPNYERVNRSMLSTTDRLRVNRTLNSGVFRQNPSRADLLPPSQEQCCHSYRMTERRLCGALDATAALPR